jgi:nitroimidazol reductase NimA-like FMN-containing flavoprotein (pyridoxamine 5'-phosphate oxidase superfamily)
MDEVHQTERTRLHRERHKGNFDREVINGILDEALVAHVGFVDRDQQPFVLPILHVRIGDNLYLHGSSAGRMVKRLASSSAICVTATLLDGLVLARAAFGQSMNFRSVVVLGKAKLVTEDDDKLEVLRAVTDKVLPGRWDDIRQPTASELKATAVLALPIEEASAKIRVGPPDDKESDVASGTWGGVVPVWLESGAPIADARHDPAPPLPSYLARPTRPGPGVVDDSPQQCHLFETEF